MSRIAFLTYNEYPNLTDDDNLAVHELEKHGVEVLPIVWDRSDPKEIAPYDLLVVRSAWNYFEHEQAFREWLDGAEAQNVPILNPPDLMRWNSSKKYMADLDGTGKVPIVPTLWIGKDDTQAIPKIEALKWDKIVIKPEVSANSNSTYLLERKNIAEFEKEIASIHDRCDMMVQPFCDSISSIGEYSLIFFNGSDGFSYSHTILKTPAHGDFRSQEEWGSTIIPVPVPEGFQEVAERSVACIPSPWLYARVDLVLFEGSPHVMELELIEPSLYFRMDPKSAERFTAALLSHMKRGFNELPEWRGFQPPVLDTVT